jgi:hypothetical protein
MKISSRIRIVADDGDIWMPFGIYRLMKRKIQQDCSGIQDNTDNRCSMLLHWGSCQGSILLDKRTAAPTTGIIATSL